MQDLRYALRTLRRSPGFTIVALLTLALGIGATSAIFTVVYSVLLRPLPFQDPARLYVLTDGPPSPLFRGVRSIADPDFLAYEKAGLLESVAGYSRERMTMLGAGEPASIAARKVTASLWKTLGVQPALGRTFGGGETGVVVLNDRLWRERFGASPEALGKSVALDGTSFTVVGVMAPGFDFPGGSELWIPTRPDPGNQHMTILQAIARLKTGVTPQQADAELASIASRFDWGPRPRRARLLPLHDLMVGNVKLSLQIFMGAVGFLLLIACVNVASLVLARGASRTQEFATRAALGAGRWRLIRQLVTESVLVSLGGGAGGLLIALWGESALVSLAPQGLLPRAPEIHVDGWVFAFTLVLSLVTGVAFGLAPAIQISRADLNESIKRGAARLAGTRLRSALVTAEIALAVMLVAGAGLLIRSFEKLRSVPTGFDSRDVVAMHVALSPETYRTREQLEAVHSEMVSRLARLPGVDAAAAVNWLPFTNWIHGDFYAEGQPDRIGHFNVSKPGVTEDYFRAMGIRLLRGRYFTSHDDARAPKVAILGKSVADRAWPGLDPIGKRVTLEDQPAPDDWLTVVGVIDDVNDGNLREPPFPAVYQPLAQVRQTFFLSSMNYIVRTRGDSRGAAALLRDQLRAVDPNQPIYRIATMDELLSDSVVEPRFQSSVLGAFAAISLLLAAVGIYGMMAYAVAARRREIGVRVALGATPADVRRLILSRSAVLIGSGLAIGLVGALAVTGVLRSLLFQVKPADPVTLLLTLAVLAGVGVAAALFPARAAARVDPVIALRE